METTNSVVPVKEKRKNSEKRKEKSRDAARCRRTKESEIFSQLAAVLPLPSTVVSHLDKASIMRLIITNLRLINLFKSITIKEDYTNTKEYDSLYLKASGGFILVLSLEGDIIFISQNVSNYLGITQVDVLGQNLLDFAHPCDQSEVRELFNGRTTDNKQKTFFIRMKCLASKGRGINSKTSSYKVLHVIGRFVKMSDTSGNDYSFISIVTPIPHPIDIEMPLGKFTFLSKHSLDMKYTFADERMKDFLGYDPESLLGKSMYDFHHAQDNKNIEKAFRCLFSKGQSDTGQYRFLAQGGGYVWVSTQATVIYCEKNNKPQSVVCVNYIVSERCEETNIYSSNQLEHATKNSLVEKRPVSSTSKLFVSFEAVSAKPDPESLRPQPATRKIFAPRTSDMNEGFLPYDDDTGTTNVAGEQDDLTHLAPTAGDSCVPLTTPKLGEVLQHYLSSGDEMPYPLIDSEKDVSLFTTFKDECSNSSHSPSISQSPASCTGTIGALCDETPGFDESDMTSLLEINASDEDLAFGQYESLSEDNLPLLLPMDIPWDFSAVNADNANDCLSCIDLKSEEQISDFESLLNNDDVLNCAADLLISKHSYDPEKRKRVSSIGQEGVKKRKHQNVQDTGGGGSSVLMNLLATGHDLSAGYVCVNPRKSQ